MTQFDFLMKGNIEQGTIDKSPITNGDFIDPS